jgi:hypothetical protein
MKMISVGLLARKTPNYPSLKTLVDLENIEIP